jgi:RNA polymerase sigma-70 factor (ECF subfamily)
MQAARTNQEWLQALSNLDDHQSEALTDLRDLLLRAALYTLVAHPEDLRAVHEQERMALAEDSAQDALQAVLARLQHFRGESLFTTWAYKFGVNITLTRLRKERWKLVSLDALSEEEDALDWLQWKEHLQSGDSEMPALQAEVIAVIQVVIRSELTGRQRQVLKWMAFDGVPMDIVVERLNSNRNAIYKLLHDARLKVKRQLAAHGYAVEDIYDLFSANRAIP